ncbi:DUF4765 family protein, partial [Escherichia coli]|nr:DUF4765 family protein [Escherichia coli]
MAHPLKSFQYASVGTEHKLFDSEKLNIQPDNIEQVISKGKALQKDFFDSYIENKETLPIITQSDGVHYKKIALNGLLLASGIFKPLNNNYKPQSDHGNLFDEIHIRHSRSLPEEHAAPAEKLGVLIAKKLEESIVPKFIPFYNILTKLEQEQEQEHYIRGYHELLTFSQTGIWNRNGRGAARDY